MAAVVIGLSIVGTFLDIIGEGQAGKTARNIAEANAQQDEAEAAQARKVGEFNKQIKAEEDRKTRATNLAKSGASGVQTDVGSPIITAAENEFISERNQEAILFGAETTALNLEKNARITRAGGRAQEQAAFLGAGTTLLTGAARTGLLINQQKILKKQNG